MVPHVSTSDLIAFSSTTVNSAGAAESPCLKPMLSLSSEDKCSPVLTLAYISLFKILHNVTFLET